MYSKILRRAAGTPPSFASSAPTHAPSALSATLTRRSRHNALVRSDALTESDALPLLDDPDAGVRTSASGNLLRAPPGSPVRSPTVTGRGCARRAEGPRGVHVDLLRFHFERLGAMDERIRVPTQVRDRLAAETDRLAEHLMGEKGLFGTDGAGYGERGVLAGSAPCAGRSLPRDRVALCRLLSIPVCRGAR